MKFLRTDIERVEKLLREELKVLKRSYTEAEGRTGGGEEEEEDDDDGEDVADMLRFVPQLPSGTREMRAMRMKKSSKGNITPD